MASTYIEITDDDGLAAAFALSDEQPVPLFVYDPYCPINDRARDQLDQLGIEIQLVNVAERSSLGKVIQLATGVRHESPQLLVLRDREVIWHASHGRIRADDVRSALMPNSDSTRRPATLES